MWVARDEDKCLYLYKIRPEKDIPRGRWQKQEKTDGGHPDEGNLKRKRQGSGALRLRFFVPRDEEI